MRELLLLICCFVLLVLGGCSEAPGAIGEKSGVNVIIEGGGGFPEFLAGRWKANKYGWEFIFESDGTISSAVINNGTMRVEPSKGSATKTVEQLGTIEYKFGEWTVQYSPDNRELVVEVVVDYFKMDVGIAGMEGESKDWFIGSVSEDLERWEADWFSFPNYVVLMPEPQEVRFDPNDNPVDTLVFKKQAEIK